MFTRLHDANHCVCHNATERVVNCKKLVVNVERVVDTKKLGVSVVNLSCLTIYAT